MPQQISQISEWIINEYESLYGDFWLSSKLEKPIVNLSQVPQEFLGKQMLNMGRWQQSPRLRKRIDGQLFVMDIINLFQVKHLSVRANRALVCWLKGDYPLKVVRYVPDAYEMLELQATGSRYVSWIQEPAHGKTPLEFLVHDLVHADHFFEKSDWRAGQIRFYQLLNHSLKMGVFTSMLENVDFKKNFEYLASDMNSHPFHLLMTLKALVSSHFTSDVLERFESALIDTWSIDTSLKDMMIQLNRPGFNRMTQGKPLSDWLMGSQ